MRQDWETGRGSSPLAQVGFGALRAAMLFGSAAAALALLAAPILDRATRPRDSVVSLADDLDAMATGSVAHDANRYTIHRSVLQSSPNAVCIVGDDGSRAGDC